MATTLHRTTQVGGGLRGYPSAILRLALFISLVLVHRYESISYGIPGWENLDVTYDSRVAGVEKSVDQKASNARQCYKMCWLFTACSAVTFNIDLQRCQLHLSFSGDHALRTVPETGSMAVDMRDAKMVPEKRRYACDLRPCKKTEMCAPVENKASYVCIPILSVFCRGDPPIVPNGQTQSDGISSVVYTCTYGYFRKGMNPVSTCDRDTGEWSDVDVTCEFVDCGGPPDLHGAKATGLGTTVDSEIVYECLAGAVPSIAQIKVTCLGETGQWSLPGGSCSVVSCGKPPTLDDMYVELKPRPARDAYPGLDANELLVAYGAEAMYECKPGYTPEEGASYISQCQVDGSWSFTSNFVCSPVDCGIPPHVANSSHMSYDATTFNEIVIVFCQPGFSPLNGIILTCDATGNWAGGDLLCDLVDCEQPDSVEGALAHFEDTKLNATTKYECVGATVTKGGEDSTATCLESGEWSPVSITCLSVPCGIAPSIKNGSVTYDESNSQFTANYSCDAGYVLRARPPSDTLKCREILGQWSRKIYFACEGISCGPAPEVEHASVAESGQTFPSLATYTCESGFVLTSAASTKICNQSGLWSQEVVTCDVALCEAPTAPSNVEFTLEVKDSYKHEEKVALSCENEYFLLPLSHSDLTLSVSPEMTCLNGTWIMPDPKVLCSRCEVPPDVPMATWELQDESPVRAVYSCDPGYSTTGSANVTCVESTLAWLGDDTMRCEPMDCGEPFSFDNTSVSTPTGTTFNATADYVCNFGYIATGGDSQRICNEEGIWTGSQLQCLAWDCDPPPDLPDGVVSFNSTTLNSSAAYTCNTGFRLSWPNEHGITNVSMHAIVATCSEERLWMGRSTIKAEDLFCDEILCPPAPDIPNANLISAVSTSFSMNEIVTYECLEGYKHLGMKAGLKRTEMGTWSDPFFECFRIDCGRPPTVEDATFSLQTGTTFGAVAEYTCNQDFYHASKQETRTCGADGFWSNELIECVRYNQDHCGDVVPVDHSSVVVTSLLWGGVVLYTCDFGYEHSWVNSMECLESIKSWFSTGVVGCRPVDCGQPPRVPFAVAYFENTTLGSHAVYECEKGRASANGVTKICMPDGSWSAEPAVECTVSGTIDCSHPPRLDNTSLTYTTTTEGSLATYSCDYGYIENVFQASCGANGHWEIEMPQRCLPVSCGTVPTVENSDSVRMSGMEYGDVAVYVCSRGFKHSGAPMKTCEGNGTWSTNLVECIPETSVICGDPPRVDHTIVEYESRLEGADATYACIAGYTSSDKAKSYCGDDGKWSDPRIRCIPVLCSSPPALDFSVVIPLTPFSRFESSVIHVCLTGHASSTNSPLISICLEDGSWSSPDGFCAPAITDLDLECRNAPPWIEYGIPEIDGIHVGSELRYRCEAGYKPALPLQLFFLTCLPEGKWSFKSLACEATLCVTSFPPPVEHAELIELRPSSNHFGNIEAVYDCLSGYTLGGLFGSNAQIFRECELSQWLDPSGFCYPVDCGKILFMDAYLVTSDNNTTTYPSRVELACKPPFYQTVLDSDTNKTISCQADGRWSTPHDSFTCGTCDQSVTFTSDPNMFFTLATLQTPSTYSDTGTLSCDPSYHLIGPSTVKCESVRGEPTWVDLSAARCVQAVWNSPTVNSFRIYQEAIQTALFACASFTMETRISRNGVFFISLKTKSEEALARVRFDLQVPNHLTTFQHREIDIVEKWEKLFEVPETMELCLVLNTTSGMFYLLKNSEPWMSMPATDYANIHFLKISKAATVQSINIKYI